MNRSRHAASPVDESGMPSNDGFWNAEVHVASGSEEFVLFDEHISPDAATGLRRRNRAIEVRYMAEWENGYFLGQEYYACLREAAVQRVNAGYL